MSKKKSPQGQTFHLNYCEIYYGKHYSFSRIFPKTVKSTHQIHLHEFFHNFSQETLSNFLYKQVSKNLQLERQKKKWEYYQVSKLSLISQKCSIIDFAL